MYFHKIKQLPLHTVWGYVKVKLHKELGGFTMKQITLQVQGMSCGHCVSSIEDNVGEINGVKSITVKLEDGKVEVEYDANKVTIDDVKKEIEELGYEVVS